ncbi:hypothetical protein [Alienimonas chondri]|uniref:Uncharacterized protein n=1 Tax=Alienimonas chondri TaxID=2681879 RepID=A0ABX1VI41_9PLAN|nr:hypothetical protein [Alienimonas chondri]NNJ27525.1 hypothetical protein [Alienimonas chondri]
MTTPTIDDAILAELAERATASGLTVDQWLAAKLAADAPPTPPPGRSLYDAMNEVGAIGYVTDAPADLSTNPVHMEGFGRS